MSGMTESPAADTLAGVSEIARFIGESEARTRHLLAMKQLPAFKQIGRWRMRKSAYLAHLARTEAAVVGRDQEP
jgi:hypothetical protein